MVTYKKYHASEEESTEPDGVPGSVSSKSPGEYDTDSMFLNRGLFRMLVLEDPVLEHFFEVILPSTFSLNPELVHASRTQASRIPVSARSSSSLNQKAYPSASSSSSSTHQLPSTEPLSQSLLSSGKSLANTVARTISSGIEVSSQFIDKSILNPVAMAGVSSELAKPAVVKVEQPGADGSQHQAKGAASGTKTPSSSWPLPLPQQTAASAETPIVAPVTGSVPTSDSDGKVTYRPLSENLHDQQAPQQDYNASLEPYDNVMEEVEELLSELHTHEDDERYAGYMLDDARTKETKSLLRERADSSEEERPNMPLEPTPFSHRPERRPAVADFDIGDDELDNILD
ncbi:hypothetical protein EV182_005246 [Spiromyces aspiralis]|uniref:Uncharacterized protein n=1 Tax=Spiromyces aspiralis TaxID=68401 RepID=A0ACC1HPC0_9FUNG|nr:hypothetical protein EV182_005246 [Spiromyces aspiralis]